MSNNKPIVTCAGCGQEKIEAARGLCRSCYSRWRKNGTLEYARDFRDRNCSVEGCDRRAHGQGLCTLHLQRLRRTGTTDPGRKYEISRPPEHMHSLDDLYPIWAEFNRPSNPRPVFEGWRASFERFKADVGARPSKMHRLFAKDRTKLLGPDNWGWRERLVVKQEDETNAEYDARHRLARRELDGSGMWNSDLLRKYGITKAQHRAMAEVQNHLCAISGRPEDRVRSGMVAHLAVDHVDLPDGTKFVRQMLRGACNTAIGLMDHDPFMLAKAILYLAKHDQNGPEAGQAAVDKAIAYLQKHPVNTLDRNAILPQD